jgi:hypothetical protein
MIQNYKDWQLNEAMDPHEKMAHIQKYLTPDQIDWCNYHIKHKNWKVNDNGEVYTPYALEFTRKREIVEIPVQFWMKTPKDFVLSETSIKNLKGSPKHVKGLNVTFCNDLESFQGGPETADYVMVMDCLKLKTLQGGPVAEEWTFAPTTKDRLKVEIELLENHSDLFNIWVRTTEKLEDFIQKHRGKIHGKKFGL